MTDPQATTTVEPAVSKKAVCSRDDALGVLLELRRAGFTAYFAGGCVRDTLLGLEAKDWDVATDAPPDRVRKLFRNTQAVGQSFGVILVRTNGSTVEVATFRSDGNYTDGRRPDSVRFATPEEDAQRRDFTINGLFHDPIENRVIDFVDGQRDLQSRTLRAIGNPEDRFAEDYLRMLRAVRFAARFGLTIDPGTARAIIANAHKLPRISPERIGDELRGMLVPTTRAHARDLLMELGLLPVLMRLIPPQEGNLGSTYDTLGALSREQNVSYPLALASLLVDWADYAGHRRDQPEELARGLRTTLRLSNDESENVLECLLVRKWIWALELPPVAAQKRFLNWSNASDAMAFIRANRGFVGKGFEDHLDALLASLERHAATDFAPTPFVTGDDLVQMGHKPGPKFKTVLDATYDAQLEDRVTTRDEAIALARQLISQ